MSAEATGCGISLYWNGDRSAPDGWSGASLPASALMQDGIDLPAGVCDRVYVGPAIGRVQHWEVVDALVEMRRVSRVGARIRVAAYDLDAAISARRRDDLDFFWDQSDGLDVGFALQVLEHGLARSLFTAPLVADALARSGFDEIRIVGAGVTDDPAGRLADPDTFAAQCCFVEARNPLPWPAAWPTDEPMGVHLGWADPRGRRLRVSWSGPAGAEATLGLRPVGAEAWVVTEADAVATADGADGRHVFRAVTGELDEDGSYEYRIVQRHQGREVVRDGLEFDTPPGDGGSEVRLGFLADTGLRDRPDGLADGVDAVVAALDRLDPHLLLCGGDYAYLSGDPRWASPQQAIHRWLDQMEALASRRPLMVQYGNHEVGLGERRRDWAVHFPPPADGAPCRSYSFDVGPCHVAAVHAPTEAIDPAEAVWLWDDLAAARRDGARWLVVFQHQPLVAHGTSHPAQPELHRVFGPILDAHRVDLHLSAHDQSYERTHPLVWDRGRPRVVARGRDLRRGVGTVLAKVSPAGKRSDRGGDFSRLTSSSPLVATSDDTAHHLALVRADRDRLELIAYAVDADAAGGREREIDRVVVSA